jgi:hypothetical protein
MEDASMPQLRVKKVVAVGFLEAVKVTLEQLGALRLELSEQGHPAPAELTRYYGDVRRLRDYLQRCVSTYGEEMDLDIAPGDAAVMVACCRRGVDAIDQRLQTPQLAPDEREWLQKKQQMLAHWALELAVKPLVELPGRRGQQTNCEASRALTVKLQNKVFGDVRDRPKVMPPQSSSNSMMQGLPSFGEEFKDVAPPPLDGDSDLGGFYTHRSDAAPPAGESQQSWAPTIVSSSPSPAPRQVAQPAPAAPVLFDHAKVSDPRLRALIGVDMRSFARAVASSDYRLATVLMAAVLEAALLDHVLPRKAALGVMGSPDSWNMQDLLLAALGDQAVPKDRSLAFHLFSARNLLRPAVQVVTPTVVTVGSFEVLREFVQRALHGLGYGAPTATMPPAEPSTLDILSGDPAR